MFLNPNLGLRLIGIDRNYNQAILNEVAQLRTEVPSDRQARDLEIWGTHVSQIACLSKFEQTGREELCSIGSPQSHLIWNIPMR